MLTHIGGTVCTYPSKPSNPSSLVLSVRIKRHIMHRHLPSTHKLVRSSSLRTRCQPLRWRPCLNLRVIHVLLTRAESSRLHGARLAPRTLLVIPPQFVVTFMPRNHTKFSSKAPEPALNTRNRAFGTTSGCRPELRILPDALWTNITEHPCYDDNCSASKPFHGC